MFESNHSNHSNHSDRKMYKVLHPMEKSGGGTYWMRLGTAFTNRDNSLKVILDAFPPANPKSNRFELHIRELDAEDLRRREARMSSASPSEPSPFGSRAVTAGGDNEGTPF